MQSIGLAQITTYLQKVEPGVWGTWRTQVSRPISRMSSQEIKKDRDGAERWREEEHNGVGLHLKDEKLSQVSKIKLSSNTPRSVTLQKITAVHEGPARQSGGVLMNNSRPREEPAYICERAGTSPAATQWQEMDLRAILSEDHNSACVRVCVHDGGNHSEKHTCPLCFGKWRAAAPF